MGFTPVLRRGRKRWATVGLTLASALIATVLVSAPAHALADTGTGGMFVPATGRILDTRNNVGGYNTPMPAATWRSVTVAGAVGLPDDGSVGAVSVVATVTDITAAGWLYGRPDSSTKSTPMGIYGGASTQNTSFSAVLAVGADGTIQVEALTEARLVLDVQGYYTSVSDGTAPGGFVPLNGTRLVDTRSGLGAPKAVLSPGGHVDIQVTGNGGVASGAAAAIVNLIAVPTVATQGALTPYPTGGTKPSTPLIYAADQATSMQAQVKLSSAGKITVYNGAGTTNLVVDVQGYFTAPGGGGAVFTPGTGRIYDTRATGNTSLGTNERRSISVAGVAGLPVKGSGLTAVVLTLTVLGSGGSAGYASVWADGTPRPNTTALNFDGSSIRTNTITVPLGSNGKVTLENTGGPYNYAIDVQGWYANPANPSVSCGAPFSSGSWSSSYPSGGLICHYVASAPSGSDFHLVVTNNDVDVWETSLDDEAGAEGNFSLDTTGGINALTATTVNANGTIVGTSHLSFGLGNWAASAIQLLPETGSSIEPDSVTLSAFSATDSFSADTLIVYTVSLDANGTSNPVVRSSPQAGDWDVPSGVLQGGQTYFWTAQAQGPSGPTQAFASRLSNVNSFTTNASGDQSSQMVIGGDADATVTPLVEGRAAAQNGPQNYENSIYTDWLDKDGYRVYLRNGVFFNKVLALHNGTLFLVKAGTQHRDTRVKDNATTYRYDTTIYQYDSKTRKIQKTAHYRVVVNMTADRIDGHPRGVVTAYCKTAAKIATCPTWVKALK